MSNTTGGKISRSFQQDWRETRSAHNTEEQRNARQQRKEDHRNGVDHGKGCTHCDSVNGR